MTIARVVILSVSVVVAIAVSGSGAATAAITSGVILALLGPPVAVWMITKRRDQRERNFASLPPG